ncbi:MAG: M48 family metallopeptidase [Acidobacteria bacterium]|nr:M48 family metallopeptidase [Acidobacteriota bacterium]
MSPVNPAPEPVLVYDRIAHNRRKTWLLVALALASLAPFVWGISWVAAVGVVARVSPEARRARQSAGREAYLLKQLQASGRERTEYDVALENQLARDRAEAERLEGENRSLRYTIEPVVAGGLIAALAVLFWGIASSPTSKLLTQAGARPAGKEEAEAQRVLENLSIGAGLPCPKLYVIEASAPNAFAAGMDPEHAVVAVTSGALHLFDHQELEGVLAHELSHIGNHDIRLNTVVASIALFLRIPYLMFRRDMRDGSTFGRGSSGVWRLAISPFGLYILFVAPVVAALIRAAVSREREFLADADAALLSGYPEGLMRALAKVGGAGSVIAAANPAFAHFYFANAMDARLGWFSGRMMATHPPLAERIERLVGFHGESALAGLDRAVEAGRKYVKEHPVVATDVALAGAQDELSVLNQGNVMGRVYRVAAGSPVPVYDMPNKNSFRAAMVQPGSLIVVFDDPGRMRQVNTADQTFGYMERSVPLKPVDDLIPAEVYDPKLRAAAEARLAPQASAEPVPAATAKPGLSPRQIAFVCGFGVVVFAGMMLVLMQFGGR